MVNKVDSNLTGLRYTMEVPGSPKTLPGSPIWLELEPNTYSDFGGTVTQTPRKPIVANRQVRQGRTTDLDAKSNFTIDFTSDNMLNLFPCTFFAAWRKGATTEVDGPTSISLTTTITKTGAFIAADFLVGSLILNTGFTNAANNGLLNVATVAAPNDITVTQTLVNETPPATALTKVVGFQGASGDITIDGSVPAAPTLLSTTLDFTTLNLIPGQWIWIGGDGAGNSFATAADNGLARIFSIAAHLITFDKTQNTIVTDAGTGKTIQLFFPDHLMNEDDPTLIVAQTVQFERSLSSAGFEYVAGSYSNTLDVEMKSADKITMTQGWQALDYEPVDFGSRKGGSFPAIETDPVAYNTATDLLRIRVAEQGNAAPLFAFVQTMTLKINNNVKPLKALGVLGAFDVTVGDFEVTGDVTAYFSDIDAMAAVRDADSLTLDWMFSLANRGWVFDLTNLTFDKGILNVVKDEAITIPLGVLGAEQNTLRTTLQSDYFAYLPDAAAA